VSNIGVKNVRELVGDGFDEFVRVGPMVGGRNLYESERSSPINPPDSGTQPIVPSDFKGGDGRVLMLVRETSVYDIGEDGDEPGVSLDFSSIIRGHCNLHKGRPYSSVV